MAQVNTHPEWLVLTWANPISRKHTWSCEIFMQTMISAWKTWSCFYPRCPAFVSETSTARLSLMEDHCPESFCFSLIRTRYNYNHFQTRISLYLNSNILCQFFKTHFNVGPSLSFWFIQRFEIVKECLKLLKVLAGNDNVKRDIAASQGIVTMINSVNKHLVRNQSGPF